MRDRKVYVVYYGEYEHIQDIEAIFDSKEQVEAFRNRFAKNEKMKVLEMVLNPEFIVNKSGNPYLITFNEGVDSFSEVTSLFGIEDCELAAKEMVRQEDGKLEIYLFATDKRAALQAARAKRSQLI